MLGIFSRLDWTSSCASVSLIRTKTVFAMPETVSQSTAFADIHKMRINLLTLECFDTDFSSSGTMMVIFVFLSLGGLS